MIRISDFNFKNEDELCFRKAPRCGCGKSNCRCILEFASNEKFDEVLVSAFLNSENLNSIALVVFLDNTAKIYRPQCKEFNDNVEYMNFDVIDLTKEEAILDFANIVSEGGYKVITVLEQVEELKYFTISPGNIQFEGYTDDYDESINYDIITGVVNYIFNSADSQNLNLRKYFDKCIDEEDTKFFKEISKIIDIVPFYKDRAITDILCSILDSYKNNKITEDQLIYYLLDGPKNVIEKIKSSSDRIICI